MKGTRAQESSNQEPITSFTGIRSTHESSRRRQSFAPLSRPSLSPRISLLSHALTVGVSCLMKDAGMVTPWKRASHSTPVSVTGCMDVCSERVSKPPSMK